MTVYTSVFELTQNVRVIPCNTCEGGKNQSSHYRVGKRALYWAEDWFWLNKILGVLIT